MTRHTNTFVCSILLVAFTQVVCADDPQVDFGRKIRPLLAEKCFACHGLDDELRETDLRLDTQDGLYAAVESGGFAVVAGRPDQSLAYERITSKDPEMVMPPPEFEKAVTPAEAELVKQWIAQGAQWKQHWAWVTPTMPKVPDVRNKAWPKNPIDNFVMAKLDAGKLKPSPEAAKTVLIRRVTYDLTGLPPTPTEIDVFLADNSSQAYERVVDRLLASPHYGEHMGRYWLDAARYGDTHGLHLDNVRQIWPYRDWVIKSFNQNMPFDQFTIEQLAGDLLPNATEEQRIATGFNRCNVTTSEGGALPEEYHVHYTVDRVATMSTVFMGISMGCVTCHESKFDPFEMKDFYQLYAFFNSLDGAVMDGNKPLPPPVLKMPNPKHRARLKVVSGELVTVEKQLRDRDAAASSSFAAWTKSRIDQGNPSALPTSGLVGHWPLDAVEGETVAAAVEGLPTPKLQGKVTAAAGKIGGACEVDGNRYIDLGDTADFDRTDAFSYAAWVKVKGGNAGGGILARMDEDNGHRGYDMYVSGNMIIAHFINTWPSRSLKVEAKNRLKVDQWHHVLVTYDGSAKAAGVKVYIDGKSSPLTVRNDTLTGSIKSEVPLLIGRRSKTAHFKGLVDDVRIYDRKLEDAEASQLAGGDVIRDILGIAAEKRSKKQQATLRRYFLTNHDEEYKQLDAQLAKTRREKNFLETDGEIASLIWKDLAKPKQAHILLRGAYDKPGEPVQRNTPAALPPLPPLPEGEIPTRLTLAQWLVAPNNPLTARVTVNRFWQQYFGAAIVKTTEDFGSQGAPPTHPQLLDWLATDFMTNGWDVQRLQKLIVMSATYRQSSKVRPGVMASDPENATLARGPRFRLDAEAIRDTALAASGLLVRKIGGPGVRPYQPPGIWKAVGYTDSNTANFARDKGEALYRRSIYTFWKRTAPPPSMVAFDAPSRENCTVRRSRTNTPLAALALMNDEQFVEASWHIGQRIMTEGGDSDRERADFGFRLVTGRRPDSAEVDIILDVYAKNLETFTKTPEDAKKLINVGESKPSEELDSRQLAAWTMIGNMILNLDETVTKE